jgi:exopolysaccharide production protein ExoZ
MGRHIISSVHMLRAIAALGVCVAHLSYEFNYKLASRLLPSFVSFGEVGVDLFFVISGFVIVHSSKELFGTSRGALIFFERRIIRIVPLYWFACAIMIGWVYAMHGGFAPLHWPLITVIANLFFIPLAYADGSTVPFLGVAWTLFFEVLFYCIFALAMQIGSPAKTVALTTAILAILVGAQWFFALPAPLSYWSNTIVVEFVFGMLIALMYSAGLQVSSRAAAAMIGIGLCGLIAAETLSLNQSPIRGFSLGIPSAFIIAALALMPPVSGKGVTWRVLFFWGNASYALYVMHPYAITVPRLLLGPAQIMQHPILSGSLMVCAALVIAAATHWCFEVPVVSRLKKYVARDTFHHERSSPTWWFFRWHDLP